MIAPTYLLQVRGNLNITLLDICLNSSSNENAVYTAEEMLKAIAVGGIYTKADLYSVEIDGMDRLVKSWNMRVSTVVDYVIR